MTAPVLQFKRGLLANLPGLRAGEPGFTTDSYDLYVGVTSEISTNKFFGSHRYWTRETTSTGSGVNLVEGTDNGSDFITLAAPTAVGAAVTYYLPASQGATSSVLTNDGSGNLSWSSGSDNATFTGITTFSDITDNTLGDENTGSVQLDGGLGIAKNLTVKQNLHVGGYSEFVGVVTFKGGTINLGDDNTDDIVVAGEFKSSLIPTDNNSYDIGDGANSKSWRNASFSGVGTFGSGAVIDSVQIGISGTTVIRSSSGQLTLLSADNEVLIDDDVNVSGTATVSGRLRVLNGAQIDAGFGNIILSSLLVSNLTDNRILIAGTGGVVEDSENLTFDGEILTSNSQTNLRDVNVSIAATIATARITNAYLTNTYFGSSGTAIVGLDEDISDGVSVNHDTLAAAKAIKTYVDDQITAQDLDFSGDTGTGAVDLDSQVLSIKGTSGEIETVGSGNTITIGLPDNVVIGAGLTVNSIRIGVSAGTEIDTTSGNLTLDSADGTTTIDDNLIVSGDLRINGNDIQASDGNTNITLTSNTLTTFAGDVRINGNDIQASDGVASISMSGRDVTVAGDLTVGGNDIKASDGTTALTFSNSTGAVTAANDLTINGNLYVSGNTTQVNTAALTVEDRTIDLGIVNGAAPASATTWDLGVLFNYHAGGSAKKSAVIWEHEDSRFKFASVLSADADGTNADSPQLAVTTFAPIEVAELWVNNTCTGGSQQVISCVGSELNLQNITIDAGTF